MKLKDRVAMVTGAAQVSDRPRRPVRGGGARSPSWIWPDAARATAEQIEKAGGEALAIAADVSRAEDNREAVAQTVGRWGRLDAVRQCWSPVADRRRGDGRKRLRPDWA